MSNVKITVDKETIINIKFRTEAETKELYSQDYLNEYGVYIDPNVLEQFQATVLQYKKMQKQLWQAYKRKLEIDQKKVE